MRKYEQRYSQLRQMVDRHLRSLVRVRAPRELTEACRYVLSAGGKRVRSSLVLLSCEAVGGKSGDALDAGAAVELMHNFTLVHDDIMDNAVSRRGRPTVHRKWNTSNALLVGDILLGMAYDRVLTTQGARLDSILRVFTDGLLQVCEGQGLDLEYQSRRKVSVSDYFRMIEKKTARMISMSTELGAVIGGGTGNQIKALRTFGHYLGRAFQLQDDLLDVVARGKELGKAIGGDIVEGKRTYLLLKSAERARGRDRIILERVLHGAPRERRYTRSTRQQHIATVTEIYKRCGAIAAARDIIRRDTMRAVSALDTLRPNHATDMLLWFSTKLLTRTS